MSKYVNRFKLLGWVEHKKLVVVAIYLSKDKKLCQKMTKFCVQNDIKNNVKMSSSSVFSVLMDKKLI